MVIGCDEFINSGVLYDFIPIPLSLLFVPEIETFTCLAKLSSFDGFTALLTPFTPRDVICPIPLDKAGHLGSPAIFGDSLHGEYAELLYKSQVEECGRPQSPYFYW